MLVVSPAVDSDRDWLAGRYDVDWAGPTMVLDGVAHRLDEHPALVAWLDGTPAGYLVHADRGDEVEVLALQAIWPGRGIGTALVRHLVEAHPDVRLVAVTTNANLPALAFWQRSGFRLSAVRVGAVDRSRAVKPAIPAVADNRIALHDEVVLTRWPDAAKSTLADVGGVR